MAKEHFVWIDWMKVLAMYLIIAGHLSVPGNRYIYVFSVPAFFILSGYLFNKEPWNLFVKKCFWNLFIPMFSLFFIILLLNAIKNNWGIIPITKVSLRALAGYQGQNYAYGGLGSLWFVYTLIVCRFIMRFICSLSHLHIKITLFLINIVFLSISILYNHLTISPYLAFNSIVDTLLAFPFFTMGFLLKTQQQYIQDFPTKFGWFIIPISLIIIYVCGRYNDVVYLYSCRYGNSLFLCLLGGIAGTFFLLFLSQLLSRITRPLKIIDILGQGSIVILGLHVFLMSFLLNWRIKFIPTDNSFIESDCDLYLLALVILMAFVPIIIFVKRFLPIVYGKLRYNR